MSLVRSQPSQPLSTRYRTNDCYTLAVNRQDASGSSRTQKLWRQESKFVTKRVRLNSERSTMMANVWSWSPSQKLAVWNLYQSARYQNSRVTVSRLGEKRMLPLQVGYWPGFQNSRCVGEVKWESWLLFNSVSVTHSKNATLYGSIV